MKKRAYVCIMVLLCALPCVTAAQENSAVKVAVLPFETFSGEQKTALGAELAMKLQRQLSKNPLIVVPGVKDMQAVIGNDSSGALTEDRLRETAKLLEANFLLSGSVTRVRDELSVDLQVFYNFPGDSYFKTYAEGTDSDAVVNELSRKIEQEIMDKAELVPPAQRPKGRAVRTTPAAEAPRTTHDMAAYEKEIARELALEEQQYREKMPPAPPAKASGDEVPAESELTRMSPPEKNQSAASPPAITDQVLGDQTVPQETDRLPDMPGKAKKQGGSGAFTFDQPVSINADSLEYDNKNNSATFRGNVVVRQGEIVMFADTIDVLYGEKNDAQPDKGKLRQLTAVGNVKVIQGERIATGQKIVFYNDEQKIVATGGPRVWQGDNVIVGTKITVYLKEDRSVVEGTPQDRVSATIFPKEKKNKKK